ncbi:MAG: SMC-Scp complex subunit ScpB [Clostridia bacterium]
MQEDKLKAALECILFVAGEPVLKTELCRALDLTFLELNSLLDEANAETSLFERGVIIETTDESVQLVSNKLYAKYVESLLQPPKEKNISQSMMETLAVVAYHQPVTRGEIEAVRGVRCEYAVRELLKQDLIVESGRKPVLGRPMTFTTTDRFLRLFGLSSLDDLPEFSRFTEGLDEKPREEIVI